MKVKILQTKSVPSLFRRIFGQVLSGPAQRTLVKRSENPYWQERGWTKQADSYSGTYQTAYGSFLGRIEQIRPGNYRLYIFDPPEELRHHSHWTCFQRLGEGVYRIHMARMPNDVGSAILGIERLLSEAFES